MIKETVNSLKGVLYERISSPLWGTYFIASIMYNWEVVLIFMKAPSTTLNRTDLINAYLYSDNNFNIDVVLVPLVITVCLLLLMPLIQTLFFVYSESMKVQGKIRRDNFESKTRLTLEQSNELRKRIININASSQEITSFQDQEINTLKETVKTLQNKIESTESDEELTSHLEVIKKYESENARMSAEISKVRSEAIKNKVDLKVDAVDIEFAFTRITGNEIGERGLSHDADFFRGGNVADISKALQSAIEAIEERYSRLRLNDKDSEPGEIGAQIFVAITQLGRATKAMGNTEASEPHDYHWAIVANLLTVINTLLVMAERNET